MQKLLRRTALAKSQAARRARIRSAKNAEQYKISERSQAAVNRRESHLSVVASIKNRREDWTLGPLAPRRDVGDAKDSYGTVGMRTIHAEKLPREQRIPKREWTIREGDRVVVLKGRDKGRIERVRVIDYDSNTVKVYGLNMVDLARPKWMREAENDDRKVQATEAPIHINDVRLIHKLDGRDVIVQHIELKVNKGRYISGTKTLIPWPETEKPEPEENDIDTLRIDVEERTWVPTLLSPPMPPSVLDELRNKYSTFRDRHDDEYVAKKMAEDEENERKAQMARMMRTPVNEVQAIDKQMKKARSTGVNKEGLLERIGAVMAEKPLGKNARKKLRRAEEARAQALAA